MPVRKLTINGETFYQWGQTGKMYKKREDAEKQGYAIEAQGYKPKPKRKGKQQEGYLNMLLTLRVS